MLHGWQVNGSTMHELFPATHQHEARQAACINVPCHQYDPTRNQSNPAHLLQWQVLNQSYHLPGFDLHVAFVIQYFYWGTILISTFIIAVYGLMQAAGFLTSNTNALYALPKLFPRMETKPSIFSLQSRRLAASIEHVDSSLAQSPGELWSCKVAAK